MKENEWRSVCGVCFTCGMKTAGFAGNEAHRHTNGEGGGIDDCNVIDKVLI